MYTVAPWIINRNQDLLWLIGSVFVGTFFLGVFYLLQYGAGVSLYSSQLAIYFIWIVVFDGTHVFATYARTYFDRQFRQNSMYVLKVSLLLLLMGPAYLLLFYFFGVETDFRAAFVAFNRFGMLFAYYHLIRQHWGIMCLYNHKAGGIPTLERRMEGLCLGAGTIYPVLSHYLAYHQSFGLGESLSLTIANWVSFNAIFMKLSAVAVIFYLASYYFKFSKVARIARPLSLTLCMVSAFVYLATSYGLDFIVELVQMASLVVFLVTLGVFLLKSWSNYQEGKLNLPKVFLFAAVLIAHNSILLLSAPYVVLYACLTIFHNVQYHRLIRLYAVNKYKDEEEYGFATTLAKNLVLFCVLAVAFNFVSTLPRAGLGMFVENEFIYYIAATFFWGIAFHHYIIDSIIWRPSRDRDVKINLREAA